MNKLTNITSAGIAALVLAACGGGGGNNNQVAPQAPAGPQAASIRGAIDQPLPSEVLPAGSLPAASIPSASLPSISLPANEIDEVPSSIDVRTIEVVLQSSQEVVDTPLIPTNQSLTAQAQVAVDVSTGRVVATLVAEGIDDDDSITMVHIHSGFAGSNGPVLVGFDQTADPLVFELNADITSFADVPGNDIQTFLDGGWYLNLHTESNPAGQLRGQVFTSEIDVVRMTLEGQQENPPIENAQGVAGVAYATVDVADEEIVLNVSVQGFTPFLDAPVGPVHLHSGFAGENGSVILPLQPVGDSATNFSGTEADVLADQVLDFAALAEGGHYINVHSAENASGEVRGQLVPRQIDVVRMELEGQQENPPISSAPGISGVAYATFNVDDERIVLNTTVEGFVPFLDAPVGPVHLHSAFAGENGPVILPLQPVDGSETVFRGTELDQIEILDFAVLAQGGYYINVHSAQNASGELRGQVVPRGVDTVRMELQGQQENPPVVNADGVSGIAYATFNSSEERIVLNTTVEGFVPFLDAPVGPVHLHNGFAGENGPVILPLQPVDGSETVFRGTELDQIDTLDFGVLAQGGYYINVHSAQNASGEVRGQVVPRNVDVIRSELQGAQENPPVENEVGISGVGYATINANEERIVLNTTVEGFVPFLNAPVGPVHLHDAFAGENGAVILPLQPVDGSETVFRGTESDILPDQILDFDRLLQGGHYINVHSEANASGEIRGQLIPRDVEAVRIELEGRQENPVVINEEGVSGIAYATFNPAAERIVLNASVEGFVPFLDAPVGPVHLHSAFAGVNGPVVLPLQPVGDSETQFRGTEADVLADQDLDFVQLLQGGHYINIHSEANASGELRGQLVSSQSAVLRSDLSGGQADPTTATAVGYLTLLDRATEQFTSNVTVAGLDASSVTVNASDANTGDDVLIAELVSDPDDPNFFSIPSASVRNLGGLLNGGYTFVADGTESEEE